MKHVTTKIITIITSGVLFLIIWLIYMSSTRNYERMKKLAYKEYQDVIYSENMQDKIDQFIALPGHENKSKDGFIFSWLYILESGDTAIIDVHVKKKVYFWQFEPIKVTMNYNWAYILKSKQDYKYALPNKYRSDSTYIHNIISITLKDTMLNCLDSIEYIMSKEKQLALIKQGYFEVLKRFDDYTVISFHEPIISKKRGNKDIMVLTAKVFFNEKNEISIIPYEVPLDLWDNYNKEK